MGLRDTLQLIDQLAEQYYVGKPYIVGGLPRDIYLGKTPLKTTDIDLTTNSPEILRLGILTADKLNVIFDLSDDGHLTVFTDEFDLDFSSHFISEKVVDYLNGGYSGLEEAFSRDFTINTLHQELTSGKIIDPTELGFRDIKDGIIRTPVPAEITLTDDPRRAYRAINLAVRYGFKIAPEITDFVGEHLEMFTSEKIKDKYISLKVADSLKENPALTLQLLKEMKLFKMVPLTGEFKKVLIENRMLADYLDQEQQKTASLVIPNNWDEYIAQGEDYQKLKNWWLQNYWLIPGKYDPSYHSWTKWYMNKYRSEWKFSHKDPLETIEWMKADIPSSSTPQPPATDFPGLFSPAPSPTKKPGRIEEVAQAKIKAKPSANLENVSVAVKNFLVELGNTAEEIGAETPFITSGWRSIKEQAEIMARNWKANGGLSGGREYLQNLYGKSYGSKMADIFETHGTDAKAIDLGEAVIKTQPMGSYHIAQPGMAIDLRTTDKIRDVLSLIQQRGHFDFKIVDETHAAGPHLHVSVKGERNFVSAIRSRKEKLQKISAATNIS